MTMPAGFDVRVGLMIEGQEGLTWERWQGIAARVEALGFESFWRSDHLASLTPGRHLAGLDTWTTLAHLATATRRVRFGALVSPITLRHPAVLAAMAATVDVMSGGRLELGLGAGWYAAEHWAFGVPFPAPAERFAQLAEGIQVIKRLWAPEPARFEGRFYRLDDAYGTPKPLQAPHPPLVIGAVGETRALRLAAEYGDEWNCYGTTVSQYRLKQQVFDRWCTALGRDPASPRRSIALPFVVGETEADRQRRAASIQRAFPSLVSTEAVERPALLRARGWLVGRPAEIVEQIGELARAGASRVILQHLDTEDDEALDTIGDAASPAVAAAGASATPSERGAR